MPPFDPKNLTPEDRKAVIREFENAKEAFDPERSEGECDECGSLFRLSGRAVRRVLRRPCPHCGEDTSEKDGNNQLCDDCESQEYGDEDA